MAQPFPEADDVHDAAAALLSSPLSREERAELEECETAIREAWLGEGQALSRLRFLQAHRDQRTARGKPIPTEQGRWRAYLEQQHGLTVAEADAAMQAWHLELAREQHRQGVA